MDGPPVMEWAPSAKYLPPMNWHQSVDKIDVIAIRLVTCKNIIISQYQMGDKSLFTNIKPIGPIITF